MDLAIFAPEPAGEGRGPDIGVAGHAVEHGQAGADESEVMHRLREEIHAFGRIIALPTKLSSEQMVEFMFARGLGGSLRIFEGLLHEVPVGSLSEKGESEEQQAEYESPSLHYRSF